MRSVLLVLFALLAIEISTRLTHALRYGWFSPLSEGLVFYSLPVKQAHDLAKLPKSKTTDSVCNVLFSGASLVYGYGAKPMDVSQWLRTAISPEVCTSAGPGWTLADEVTALSRLNPMPRQVVFISGFNDIANIRQAEKLRSRRVQLLSLVPGLNHSLFLHKLGRLLQSQDCQPLNGQELELFRRLTEAMPSVQFTFILQPVNPEWIQRNSCVMQRQKQFMDQLSTIERVRILTYWETSLSLEYMDACHLLPSSMQAFLADVEHQLKLKPDPVSIRSE